MAKKDPDALLEALDKACMALLERASGNASLPAEGEPERAPFAPAEQIKAIETVCAWAERRAKIVPRPPAETEPKETKFDGIRNRVNFGGKARIGRSAGSAGEEEAA
jgi:hypothetical protein